MNSSTSMALSQWDEPENSKPILDKRFKSLGILRLDPDLRFKNAMEARKSFQNHSMHIGSDADVMLENVNYEAGTNIPGFEIFLVRTGELMGSNKKVRLELIYNKITVAGLEICHSCLALALRLKLNQRHNDWITVATPPIIGPDKQFRLFSLRHCMERVTKNGGEIKFEYVQSLGAVNYAPYMVYDPFQWIIVCKSIK
jgi:hypothetical protein